MTLPDFNAIHLNAIRIRTAKQGVTGLQKPSSHWRSDS
jgi:hypothetical protein